jgi:D-alanyl-D-alanine carboxypeptidase
VVSRSIALVRVRPASAAGAPPLVLTDPAASAPGAGGGGGKDATKDAGGQVFVVRNAARTVAAGKNRVTVKLGIAGDRIVVDVAGTLVAGTPGVALRRRVPQPALHAAMLMRQALVSAGIAVRGPAALGAAPGTAGFVEVHRSPPLSTLLRKINKDSDNDQAERVLEAVGAEVRGGAASTAKGLSVLRDVIGALGLPPRSYIPRNGSGLGHANRITADAMADLLRVLYLDPRVGPEIMQSLSVGGIDGTTRNRFKGTLAARRVRAKTGTLNGKSCLSGLVGDGDDVVAFAIMVQGIRGRRLGAVRAAQVGAVNAIMRYVREGTGQAVELPADFAEATVGRDFETGEEIMESEGEASESVPQAADADEPGPTTSSR